MTLSSTVLKRTATLGILAIGLVALFQNLSQTLATEAYVNAPLIEVVSPIGGTLKPALPAIGTRVSADVQVLVENHRADQAALLALDEKLAEIDAKLDELKSKATLYAQVQKQYSWTSLRFRDVRGAYLDSVARQAQARHRAMEAAANSARETASRFSTLSGTSISVLEAAKAQSSLAFAESESVAAAAQAEAAAISRKAIREGLQISEGQPDRLFSEQQALDARLQATSADVAHKSQSRLREQLLALRKQTAAALGMMQSATLPLPQGVVWNRQPEGSFVAAGQSVGTLAPCSELVITATLGRRDFRRLALQQEATVRLKDADGRSRRASGKVLALVGAASVSAREWAVAFGRASSEGGFGAIVGLDDPALLDCRVGAAVEVEFAGRSAWRRWFGA